MYEPAIRRALRLARGGYAYGGLPTPDFTPQGPSIDIYSQVPGLQPFSFTHASPTTVDNIPSGQQGPSTMQSSYTPTPEAPAPAPAPAPVEDTGGGVSEGRGDGGGGGGGMGGMGNGEKRGGRIWPKNNTGDNAVRLAHLIHQEMRSDPLFERKIQSILSRL